MRVVTLSAALLAVSATASCVQAEAEATPAPVLVVQDNSDDPLAGLTRELQQAFDDGDAFFLQLGGGIAQGNG
jgi:hypothetical protein